MTIAPSIADLPKLSTDEVIKIYDDLSKSTVVGTKFYLGELRAREANSVNQSVQKMTKWITGLTLVMTGLTGLNVYLVYLTMS